MYLKAVLSAAAIGLTLYAFIPYIRGILRGAVKPHVFTWVIWGISTFVVFLAQLSARGGAGAWAVGVSASITLFIAGLAYLRRGDIAITPVDWLFFITALLSLPLWYLTADPLWAVVILTTVDLMGFGPTVRKIWKYPYTESMPFYGLFLVRNLLVVLALESYSLTTVLFPAAVATACAILIGLIVLRRRAVDQTVT